MATKSIIGKLPTVGALAAQVVGRITPSIVDALKQPATDVAVRLELLDILAVLLARHAHLTVIQHAAVGGGLRCPTGHVCR